MYFNFFKNRNGSTLLAYTVLIFSAMMIVVFTLNSIVLNQLKITQLQAESTKAYFAAEAGAEWLTMAVIKGSLTVAQITACADNNFINFTTHACEAIATPPASNNNKINLTNNAFSYIQKTGTTPLIFKCYGEYKNAKRVIKISF